MSVKPEKEEIMKKKKKRTISNGKIIYDFLSGAGIYAWTRGVTKSS